MDPPHPHASAFGSQSKNLSDPVAGCGGRCWYARCNVGVAATMWRCGRKGLRVVALGVAGVEDNMNTNPQYFSFVARFVDAVVTEPLSREILRSRRQRVLIEAVFDADSVTEPASIPAQAA